MNRHDSTRCPMCAPWGQDQPNCGHGMERDVWVPRAYFTRQYVESIELGTRAVLGLNTEEFTSAVDIIRYRMQGATR